MIVDRDKFFVNFVVPQLADEWYFTHLKEQLINEKNSKPAHSQRTRQKHRQDGALLTHNSAAERSFDGLRHQGFRDQSRSVFAGHSAAEQ